MGSRGWALNVGVPGVGAGIGFAIAAGGAWAVYMWLGSRGSRRERGRTLFALGMAIGALGYVWLAIPGFW